MQKDSTMAIEFDSSAPARIRNGGFRNGNAIANPDGKGLEADGKVPAEDVGRPGPACRGIPGIF